jgi:uracil-DNA glycosylase
MTDLSPQSLNSHAALLWQLEHGVDMPLADELVRVERAISSKSISPAAEPEKVVAAAESVVVSRPEPAIIVASGLNEARAEAIRLAMNAQTLDELRSAIVDFDGIQIKKHATNMVFADGYPQAQVMVVGEAPGGDEDLIGKPFMGEGGQLLDRMLAAIGFDRTSTDFQNAVYISNILNWRPPGNRSPTQAEIDMSLPFIERHIQLVAPKILLVSGGVAAKALLNSTDGITKLRGKWFEYRPHTLPETGPAIPVLSTYHPSFLLRTPLKKREAWADLLTFNERFRKLTIS